MADSRRSRRFFLLVLAFVFSMQWYIIREGFFSMLLG